MHRKHLVSGAASICAFVVVAVLLFRFVPERNGGSLTAKRTTVNTPSLVAPKRLVTSRARTPVVPLPFNPPSRATSTTGQGKTLLPAGAAHDRFARWVESYFLASTSGDKAAL